MRKYRLLATLVLFCTIFGITGYPTKIIIDPEGKIVRSIIGESPAFYTYLDELFQ